MPSSRSPRLPFALLVICLLLGPATAAAQDEQIQETRSVESFTEIELSIPGTVHLRQGTPRSVAVEGQKKVLDRLVIVVDGETLEIRSEESGMAWLDWFSDDELEGNVNVYVTAPTVTTLSIAGTGDIVGETPIEGASLELQNAGVGNFDLNLDVDHVAVEVAGTGHTQLRGTAPTFSANIAGTGNVQATDLRVDSADVSIAGTGEVRLHVRDHLSSKIMGTGDVRYRGSPQVDTSVVGSGEVAALE